MSYADLIRRTWQENVLFSVLIELTYQCNLNCYYCYNDREQQGIPLSQQQYFDFFDDLRSMGVLHLVLSGGEPLMHPDFFTLGARARQLGFVIRVKSNGHALDKETVSRIRAEVDPFMVDISLHGATGAVHDRQTGVSGSFERLLKNLHFMQEQGLRFRLNSALTRWNEDEIGAMFSLAHGFDIPLNISMSITPRDSGDMEPLSIIPEKEAVIRTMQLLKDQAVKWAEKDETVDEKKFIDCESEVTEKDTGKVCGSGSSTVTVDPYGNVLPCVQWREPAGNLHQQSIKEIWLHAHLLREVREITSQAKEKMLEKWPELDGAGYCPAVARLITGNPLEEDAQSVNLKIIRSEDVLEENL